MTEPRKEPMNEPTIEPRSQVSSSRTNTEPRRMHVALDTRDVAAASRFYEAFFAVPPVKSKPRYAKFTLDDPPLALALIESDTCSTGTRSGLNHLGIQVATSDAVRAAIERLTLAGLAEKVEQAVDCCYARQDKVWARDPDGNRWEIYAVLADAEQLESAPAMAASGATAADARACCADSCCS